MILYLQYRYYTFYMKKKDDLSVSPFRLKIQLSVSSFILMAHYIACIFYKISHCHDQPGQRPCQNLKQISPGNFTGLDTYTWTYECKSTEYLYMSINHLCQIGLSI